MQTATQKESDKELRDAVQRHLEWEPVIISKDISVSANEGVITLAGFVHNYAEKYAGGTDGEGGVWRSGSCERHRSEVGNVVNQIAVAP